MIHNLKITFTSSFYFSLYSIDYLERYEPLSERLFDLSWDLSFYSLPSPLTKVGFPALFTTLFSTLFHCFPQDLPLPDVIDLPLDLF